MAKSDNNPIVKMLEEWYSKLPPLPKSWNEVIVKITPWVALIFGVLGVVGSLAAVGILTFLAPFVAMGAAGVGAPDGVIGSVLALVASGLMVAAFPGTRNRKISGWNLLFWSELVSLVSSVLFISIGGVIGVLIGFYILFQIKHFYH